jgi:hypothetical protein
MSDTPRTDAAQREAADDTGAIARMEPIWSTMEALEHELNEANAQLRSLNLELKESYNLKDSLVKGHLELDERLKEANADRLRLRGLFQKVSDNVEYPEPHCYCHKSPPCNDCVENGGVREVLDAIKQALTTPPPPVVAKPDADALAEAIEYTLKADAILHPATDHVGMRQALQAYRNKYQEGKQ